MQMRKGWTEGPTTPMSVAIFTLGGPAEAAEKLGVTRQTVYLWLKRGRLVDDRMLQQAKDIAKLTGVSVGALLSGTL